MQPRNNPENQTQAIPAFARVLGASSAGFFEVLGLYPFEVISKRMQTCKIDYSSGHGSNLFNNIKNASLGDTAKLSFKERFFGLYAGFGLAITGKIILRSYRFAGQPIVRSTLEENFNENYTQVFGERYARLALEGTAGILVGLGEAPTLLPLDALKTRYQTNREAVQGKTLLSVICEQKAHLFKGLGWAMGRNAVGCFSLFTVSSFLREHVMQPTQDKNGNLYYSHIQKLGIYGVASAFSVTLSNPLDLIKTRIQSGKEIGKNGRTLVSELIKNEGVSALFKGLTVKLVTTAPRLAFAFFASEKISEIVTDKYNTYNAKYKK